MPQNTSRLAELVEELKRSQAELEAQNDALHYSRIAAEGASERFESLFSKVPLALMVVDELGMVVQSNAMSLNLFRPNESDPPLNFLLPLVDDDHLDRVGLSFEQAQKTGSSEVKEVLFKRGLQDALVGDLHIARIEYSQDSMAHFICAVIDQGPLISERQSLQLRNEELRLSETRMEAIINSSMDAIMCADDNFLVTVFNPAAAALFQCSPEQALGMPLAGFLPQVVNSIGHLNFSTSHSLGEVLGLTAQGMPLDLEVNVSYERHSEGNITTVFARDLTARKAMEHQLRESQKMQAIGTMAGGIAHDFNNILGAILGNVSLAKQDAGSESLAQMSLNEIDKAGRRARDLVRQILTFSRNEAPHRQPMKLNELVLENVGLIKVGLPPHVRLTMALDADSPWVLADPTQIGQAVLNLCGNGIQAIGEQKGKVHIELSGLSLDSTQAQSLGIEPGLHAVLHITDTGCGMDEATVQRIFEPFFTTKEVGKGTGLGLAVVHGVMRTHEGAVEVHSKPGEGSTFKLYFPAMEPTAAQEAQAAQALQLHESTQTCSPNTSAAHQPHPNTGAATTPHAHVMYVDDDTALAYLIKRALGRRGYQVSTYNDPREAIEALKNPEHQVDLMVTDFNMPGFSGVELLNEVAALRPQLPKALASGYITPQIEAQALAAGALSLIHKPNDVDDMCATVEELLQAHRAKTDAAKF